MEPVKRRIMEYLAVLHLRAQGPAGVPGQEEGNRDATPSKPGVSKGLSTRKPPTILCLVGPPGTGKTSIAQCVPSSKM